MNVSANYGSCVDLQSLEPGEWSFIELSMNMGGAGQSVTSAGYFLQQCFIFGRLKGPLCCVSLVGSKSQIGRCYCLQMFKLTTKPGSFGDLPKLCHPKLPNSLSLFLRLSLCQCLHLCICGLCAAVSVHVYSSLKSSGVHMYSVYTPVCVYISCSVWLRPSCKKEVTHCMTLFSEIIPWNFWIDTGSFAATVTFPWTEPSNGLSGNTENFDTIKL